MKRLLIALTVFVTGYNVSAQGNLCTGCAVNPACDNPAERFPALCPAVLPDGEAGQSYSQDITFYMPFIIDASGFTGLNLEELTVTSISGIPAGLSWTTNAHPTNFYDISSDPNTQRGCAKICGTPVLPGSYTATVSVLVKICNIPIVGCSTMTQSLLLPITINAPAGGNPYFSFNPSTGCGDVNVTFQGLLNLGLPKITEYEWDFGNGNVSTVQNPPVQNYSGEGEYHPTLVTNVYNHVFNSLSATLTGNWWNSDGPIDEGWFGGQPDLQWTLTHGTASYTASEIANNSAPSWNNLGVVLDGMNISITFVENDTGNDDQGGSHSMVLPGVGVYNFSTTTTDVGYNGGVVGSFTIIKALHDSYVVTDTLTVYNLPALTDITSSTGSFTACNNQEIILSVYEGYNYVWYKNDTTLIIGADSSSYVVPDPGNYPTTTNYKVKIIDPNTGCAIFTPNKAVTINEAIPDLFGTFGATYIGGELTSNYSGYSSYQWLLNGVVIPSGQTQSYTPTSNGSYSLVVVSAGGCTDTSNTLVIANMSVDQMSGIDEFVSVYPNPSNGEFTINLSMATQSSLVISLVDISGKTVYQENVGQLNGTYSKTFNLQSISSGIYTLNLQFDQTSVRRKLIIR